MHPLALSKRVYEAVYYHVDRFRSLVKNQTGGLNGSPYNFALEDTEVLERYFPARLTPFGQKHVLLPPLKADKEGRPHSGELEELGGRQALEYIWEHQRREVAPETPSRLDSWFACPDLESARLFCRDRYFRDGADKKSWPTSMSTIWRMKGDEGHRGDMNWLPWNGGLTDVSSAFTLADLVYCARRYWQGEPRGPMPFWEVLLTGFWVEDVEEEYDASDGGAIQPQEVPS